MGKKTRLFFLVAFITLVEVVFHIANKHFELGLNAAIIWIMPAVAVWDSICKDEDAERKKKEQSDLEE